jgi:hypothetical protein
LARPENLRRVVASYLKKIKILRLLAQKTGDFMTNIQRQYLVYGTKPTLCDVFSASVAKNAISLLCPLAIRC